MRGAQLRRHRLQVDGLPEDAVEEQYEVGRRRRRPIGRRCQLLGRRRLVHPHERGPPPLTAASSSSQPPPTSRSRRADARVSVCGALPRQCVAGKVAPRRRAPTRGRAWACSRAWVQRRQAAVAWRPQARGAARRKQELATYASVDSCRAPPRRRERVPPATWRLGATPKRMSQRSYRALSCSVGASGRTLCAATRARRGCAPPLQRPASEYPCVRPRRQLALAVAEESWGEAARLRDERKLLVARRANLL